jgi:hypothetical protein
MPGGSKMSIGRAGANLATGADVRERYRRLLELRRREFLPKLPAGDADAQPRAPKLGGRIRIAIGSPVSTGAEADAPE